jgi:hypothetical protein
MNIAGLDDWLRLIAPAPLRVRDQVLPVLRDKLLGLTRERREATITEVRRVHADKLPLMTPLSREKWNEFVDEVQESCPRLNQTELRNLSGVLGNLEVSRSKYGLLKKLHELKPEQLDDLHTILDEWTVDMAKIVLDGLVCDSVLLMSYVARLLRMTLLRFTNYSLCFIVVFGFSVRSLRPSSLHRMKG